MEKTNALTKILIKIFDEENNSSRWIHLCYIPEELYTQYKTQSPEQLMNLNATLSRWVKEDFDKDLAVLSAAELDMMKNLVKGYYKETYPDVYLEQTTDRQGWLRVWIVKKMKEDLGINGE